MSWKAESKARSDHHITHHNEDGEMWSSCKCGWRSHKRLGWDNWQVTGSKNDGIQHQNLMVGIAKNKALGLQ